MTVDEAKRTLFHDTFDDDGTYVRLRLGEDPGEERVKTLRLALRVLWREFSRLDNLPREVAFACGSILQFREECLQNVRGSTKGCVQPYSPIEMRILDIAQGAFDVLAGANAETVPRQDLGEIAVGE